MSIKVAITDDHPLAINGISMMLASHPDIQITDTYTSGTALLEGLSQRQPDVLLLDMLLPDKSGIDLAPVIIKTYPDVRIVVLTSLDTPAMVKSMLSYGCLGYLLKGTDQHTLIEGIMHAWRREEFLDPVLKEYLLQTMLKTDKPNTANRYVLTKRETQILHMVIAGDTTQQIAEKLFISARTAETHRLSILKKLEVKNTASLVKKAIQLGLIDYHI